MRYKTSFAEECPQLAAEWHPDNKWMPNQVSPKSAKRIRWKCSKGHEWVTAVHNRANGTGCKRCLKRPSKANSKNNLEICYPEIAKQWNYIKNDLYPHQVSSNSNVKFWWICTKEHEWQATVSHRTRGTRCPYCSGHRVCKENSLATLKPEFKRMAPNQECRLNSI